MSHWNLPHKYISPKHLPETKSQWINILNKKIKEIYMSELEAFLKTNGKIIATIFNHDDIMKQHKKNKNSYQGFLCEISHIYSNDNNTPSTEKLSKSIRLLLNSTGLNWSTGSISDWMDSHGSERSNSGAKRCP